MKPEDVSIVILFCALVYGLIIGLMFWLIYGLLWMLFWVLVIGVLFGMIRMCYYVRSKYHLVLKKEKGYYEL